MIRRVSAGIRRSADDGFDYATYHGGLGARLRTQPDGSLSHTRLAHCQCYATYTQITQITHCLVPNNSILSAQRTQKTAHSVRRAAVQCNIVNNHA